MLQHKVRASLLLFFLYICFKNIYPPFVFGGWKQWILHGFSPKTKVPGFWRRLALAPPFPHHPVQTPRKEPPLKFHREERRCLPASSRPCYFIFMCGFQMGKAQWKRAKVKVQALFFGNGGLSDVCRGVGGTVMEEKEKKKTYEAYRCVLFCSAENQPI